MIEPEPAPEPEPVSRPWDRVGSFYRRGVALGERIARSLGLAGDAPAEDTGPTSGPPAGDSAG